MEIAGAQKLTVRIRQKKITDAKLASIESRMKSDVAGNIDRKIQAFIQEAFARTPVFTGLAVANYYVTIGNPAAATVPALTGAPQVETNALALGTEPRRGPNQDLSQARFSGFKTPRDLMSTIYITNTVSYFLGLEYGTIPWANGKRSRTPAGGIMRAAAQRMKL